MCILRCTLYTYKTYVYSQVYTVYIQNILGFDLDSQVFTVHIQNLLVLSDVHCPRTTHTCILRCTLYTHKTNSASIIKCMILISCQLHRCLSSFSSCIQGAPYIFGTPYLPFMNKYCDADVTKRVLCPADVHGLSVSLIT